MARCFLEASPVHSQPQVPVPVLVLVAFRFPEGSPASPSGPPALPESGSAPTRTRDSTSSAWTLVQALVVPSLIVRFSVPPQVPVPEPVASLGSSAPVLHKSARSPALPRVPVLETIRPLPECTVQPRSKASQSTSGAAAP